MFLRLKILTLILSVCLLSQNINAQETKDGFIILANGSYEYGIIRLDPALNIYEECLFTPDVKKEFIRYSPDQILGYGIINGIHYSTKEITIGATSQKYFLKKEIDELIRFYSYQNNRFFIEKDNFEELTNSNYKALLTNALKSCKSISSSIKKSSFDAPNLRGILIKYQHCTDPESDVVPFTRIQYEVMAGTEFNNTTLNGNRSNNKIDLPLIDKTLFSAGVNLLVSFERSKHLALAAGAYYYQQNFYAIQNSATNTYSSKDKINFNYHELLIPIALHYSVFKKNKIVMPYVKAGTALPVSLKSSLTWVSEQEYANAVYFESYSLPQKFKPSLSLTLSAGASFTLVGTLQNVVEISYMQGSGKSQDSANTITTDSNRIVALIGFRF